MKQSFLSFFLFSLALTVSGQTVENIRVEPDGDHIRISYRIGASLESHLYNVSLQCSLDGGERFTPEAVEGDVGANIRGGKGIYVIRWDVFKDVEEVGDAEFFIKVDLVKAVEPEPVVSEPVKPASEPEPKQEQQTYQRANPTVGTGATAFDRKAFLGYSGSTSSPYGFNIGLLKNYGFYAGLRAGMLEGTWYNLVWVIPSAGLTKHLMTRGSYRMHAYGGVGTSYAVAEESIAGGTYSYNYFTLETGVENVIGKFCFHLGLELRANQSELQTIPVLNYSALSGPAFAFGVGFVF
ncbi:MAG: hypothetical protein R2751_20015 [Bacteroidales bacterium]